ncbi:acid protease [Favolaschia claudopus]|uniref:Acid protease n=1 Tax=Favolaschia claudopus TaxID=2862362 RepID=A0AAW0DJW9_9AGAR
MFKKAALMFSFTLALSVAAVPATSSPVDAVNWGTNSSISVRRRASFTKPNGVFDKDKAVAATVATKNKHRQNLINLQKNKGLAAFNAGAKIGVPASVPVDVEARLLRKRQDEGLTDEQQDLEWAGGISVGTPKHNFLIDFDTGSADLWIPSSACKSSTCAKKSKYNPGSSSTSSKKPGKFSIEYGDRSSVSGPIYTDTVTVAGIALHDQYFSGVDTLSSLFEDSPVDGILGMAWPSISNLQQEPFFNKAIDSGAVKAGVFGLYLASSRSTLYLGGTDTSKYRGEIEYINIDNRGGFWRATGGEVKVGGSAVVRNIDTIIDSGTTLMYGPPSLVAEIFAKVKGSRLFDKDNGYYSYPCNSPPTISFSWGGADWTIFPENINLGATAVGSTNCVASLAAMDLGLGKSVFLLGDAYMKNVYSVFNFDKAKVGFAELK